MKRVVIAGMGDTGSLVATRLARRFEVVGVSTVPLFVSGQELGMRLARPASWRRDYLHDFASFRRLDGVRIVHGSVVRADLDSRHVAVKMADGGTEDLGYDALVAATGTSNGFWRTDRVRGRQRVEDELAAAAGLLAAARSVAVIGGGPSGVGTASQVADAWPSVSVALYHGADEVLPGYHPRTRARVTRLLARQGVTVVPGRRAIVPEGAPATLGPATVRWEGAHDPVTADVVVWAVGRVRPHTSWLPPEVLTPEGFVRVEPTLRVPGHPSVFAIGDVAATDPLRSSARNFGYRIAAHNIQAALTDRGRQRTFRPPRFRWGSVVGAQSDGMRIHGPRGGVVRLTPSLTRRVLYPLLTHRLIYGGVRTRGR